MFYNYQKRKNNKIIYSDKDNLKSIKITTIAVIIMISILIYACDGVIKQKIEQIENLYGRYHIEVQGATETQYKKILRNSSVEKAGLMQYYSTNKVINRWVDVVIGNYDETSRELLNIKLVQGRLPREINEIVFEDWVIEYLDLENKNLDINYVTLDNLEMGSNKDYANQLPKHYRIVGLINKQEDGNVRKNVSKTVGLVSEEKVKEISANKRQYHLYLKVKNIYQVKALKKTWSEEFGIESNNIVINQKYINELNDTRKIRIFRNLMIFVIILATTMILNNIYANFNYEKIRYIGILRAIGTTKKQIYKIILYEIVGVNIKAIIMGVTLGIIGYIPLTVLFSKLKITLLLGSVNMKNISLIIIFSFILVLVIAIINILRVNKMTILELLSVDANIDYGDIKSVNKFMLKITQHIGTIGKLAFKNIWRNSKKAKKGMLMIMSVCVIFIMINSLKPSKYYFGMINKNDTDIIISTDFAGFTHKDLAALREVKGIKTVATIQDINVYIDILKKDIGGIKTDREIKFDGGDSTSYLKATVIEFQTNIFKNSKLIQGRINLNEMEKQDKILVNEKFIEMHPDAKIGSKIFLNFPYINSIELKYDERKVEIVGIVNFENNNFNYDKNKPYIFMNKQRVKLATNRAFYRYFQISLDYSLENYQLEEARNEIQDLMRSRNSDKDIEISKMNYKSYKQKTKAIGITLLLILALMAVLSIISTTNEIIMNRARELSMYRILGMTKKQLRNMILLEGIFIGGGSATMGTLGGIFFMSLFRDVIELRTKYIVEISYKWIILLYISINIISLISGFISLKSIEKKKLSECIRMVK